VSSFFNFLASYLTELSAVDNAADYSNLGHTTFQIQLTMHDYFPIASMPEVLYPESKGIYPHQHV
jgi:hypothetical protein